MYFLHVFGILGSLSDWPAHLILFQCRCQILIFCTRGRCLDAAHVDLSSEVLSELQVKYFLSSRMISNFLESRKTFPVRLYSRTEIRQIRVHTLTTVKHASSPQYRQKQTGTNLEICLNSIANVEVQILLEWKHLEESKGKGQLRGKSLFFRLLYICSNVFNALHAD